jgi:hypothetical protein
VMPEIKGKGDSSSGTRSATRKEGSTRSKRARSATATRTPETASGWSATVSAEAARRWSATVSAEAAIVAFTSAEATRRKRHAVLFEATPERGRLGARESTSRLGGARTR